MSGIFLVFYVLFYFFSSISILALHIRMRDLENGKPSDSGEPKA